MDTLVEKHERNTSASPAQQLPIVFGKKELVRVFGYTRTEFLPKLFFNPNRLNKLGIDPEQYKKIRLFNFEQCAAIKKELAECGI